MKPLKDAKIAIVHDWLVTYAGAERVLEQMMACYPHADLFSLIDCLPQNDRSFLKGKKVRTSFLNRLPFIQHYYRNMLPLMPRAIESLDVSHYDLVISSSHAVAKGIRTHKDQLHICYCNTPMRYVWDMQARYLDEANLQQGFKGFLVKHILNKIRTWDFKNSHLVNHFIANSYHIKDRIKRCYQRESIVIYPCVDTDQFQLKKIKKSFYVTASRMVPYKKIPLIIEAFNHMPDKQLKVIGEGPQWKLCQKLARPNIELLGWRSKSYLKENLQDASAFIFAAEEDFGIAPLEAQACGTPVIAYGKGGALETVIPLGKKNPTGLFFREQSVAAIIKAVKKFEKNRSQIKAVNCRQNALRFSNAVFFKAFKIFIQKTYRTFYQAS